MATDLSWFEEQRNWFAQAQKDRLNRATEHYTQLLNQIGFSDFKLELSLDNSLKNLNVTINDDHEIAFVSCCVAEGDGDVLYCDIPYACQDVLVAIKSVEDVRNEDYAIYLLYALKNKGFSGIRYDYRIEEQFGKLRVIMSKMEQKYGLYVQRYAKPSHTNLNTENSSRVDFDNMDGHQFENFCAQLLSKRGYEDVMVTQGSGDQGVDIIAYKDGIKYGIQCKCYSSVVGNKAVQEVFAGKTFYQCHVGIVITNNYFSDSAIALARQNGIVLWNRDKLLQMLSECN